MEPGSTRNTLASFPRFHDNNFSFQASYSDDDDDDETSSLSSTSTSVLLPQEDEEDEVFKILKFLISQSKLGQWANQLTKTLQTRKKVPEKPKAPKVFYSVFACPPSILHAEKQWKAYPHHSGHDLRDFEKSLSEAKQAIDKHIFPCLISKGSSGSYFVNNDQGRIIAVFKPKDEEPYGKLNPKWTKWFHRNLFPCFFGRSCLIPNLCYLSEAAACLLDRSLGLYIVPYTGVVSLASPTFNYDYFARKAFLSKNKSLPLKLGSFQQFLDGYTLASQFLESHPWPGTRHREHRDYAESVGSSQDFDIFDPFLAENEVETDFWTEDMRLKFRFEFEKLVLLDYLMRNTDRNLDNWMIKVCYDPCNDPEYFKSVHILSNNLTPAISSSPMNFSNSTHDFWKGAHFHIGAIDNSLAFPYKHPDSWRSFPYGWLSLPRSILTQPFTEFTRQLFLHKITSREWWESVSEELRNTFSKDEDFDEKMYKNQLYLVKGQAYNIVETLKDPLTNIIDLLDRPNLYVVDDIVQIKVDESLKDDQNLNNTNVMDNGFQSYGTVQPASSIYPQSKMTLHRLSSFPSPGHKFTELTPLNANSPHTSSSVKEDITPVIFERLLFASSNAFFTSC
ncbi:phosphatidylinositol 4-kinase Lsb6 [Schizosaccharomyces cryophilus OY26]|uniref:Phosphatidylinositol 4-kinase n=1 Tax=Schizosaccharomyces cryophilus (strain OY26 / ATCC MYA-4695 / CBS 11777 / NBRC 106824 / NRRL Y48691) TaxID=653667 RepID=S9VUA8_SCHCR|nr:phosphatidylinositol 4-kinase Lsb6 [Schizosaccharomyces cryophilus OY26]EPY49695.1 phosphatidylinositol 4-kinase Lsb6 [Schizosaccharomyces cryophilus OY26]